uniref:sensor histidine kinase n=1 Tax=Rhodoflexus caldus TaxID=2891236 RepID=UPI00202AA22F|nr:HAMP domain-containing sensor histidine kinase [Rhodoflexus caldus]
MQKLHVDDIDEALILRKKEFQAYHLPNFTLGEIPQWNKYNRDIKLIDTLQNLTKDSLLQQPFHDELDNEIEPYRVLYSPIRIEQKTFTLLVRQNLIENEDLIFNILGLYAGLLVLLLAGLFGLTQYFSRQLWKGFYDTLQQLETFELGKTDAPTFEETHIQEFERLNSVLQHLIQKSIAVFESQQEFIENASHELQTPLAVLQAKLDTFLQMPDLSQAQMQALDSLYDLLARLNRLNKNLLLLSKIDKLSFQNLENINLKTLIEKQVSFFEEQALQKNIRLEIDVLENVEIKTNHILIEIFVSNLLLNAIRHNHKNGLISISLKQNELQIGNTGQPFPLPENKLFRRFAKIDSSTQGNGLGLAIIKKIADLYRWSITYVMKNNLHTFTINFNKS